MLVDQGRVTSPAYWAALTFYFQRKSLRQEDLQRTLSLKFNKNANLHCFSASNLPVTLEGITSISSQFMVTHPEADTEAERSNTGKETIPSCTQIKANFLK